MVVGAAAASERLYVMRREPTPASKAATEAGTAIDYESPPRRPRGLLGLLRVRHDEPLTGRHVVTVLAALVLFIAFLVVMLSLFPQGG
jgi:hypothetical protein